MIFISEIIINKYSEDGICYPKITLNIRTIPCATTGVILDQYYVGESVIYDQVVITDKYTWISWLSTSGRRVYMAIKDRLTGERFGDCYDIPSSSTGTETIVQEYSESGICYPRMTMNIRDLPCASTGTILDQYFVGESVIYDYVAITDKYVWISWISRSGARRYMAVKDVITGERFGDCGDVPNGLGESNTPTGVETIVSEYSESGICYPQMTTSIRSIPCGTTGVILDHYYLGESVIYDYVVITNKYVWISWTSGSGRRVYMTVKDQTTGERWGICEDISGNSGGSTSSSSGLGMPGVKKIFIDAGHGGSDPGALGNGLQEKDIVLSIAQKLTALFNSKGIQVSHSRYSDVSVGLSERAEMANNWGADLFISIHTNALDGSGSAYGTECYTHPNSTSENKRLSVDIASSISSKLGTYNRGHKEADFAVLRLTNMPAVLIETAFIDNSEDADKLNNRQNDFANAICDAIVGDGNVPTEPSTSIEELNNIGFAKKFGVEFATLGEEILIAQSDSTKITLQSSNHVEYNESNIVLNIENGKPIGGTYKTEFLDFAIKLAEEYEISVEKALLELGDYSTSIAVSTTGKTISVSVIQSYKLSNNNSAKQTLTFEFDEDKIDFNPTAFAEDLKEVLINVLKGLLYGILIIVLVAICVYLALNVSIGAAAGGLLLFIISIFDSSNNNGSA